MIRRLEIRDLVVIAHAEIEPHDGLTVITGETGAGKTVLAQALELLAGGAADARLVRPGARHALVQATLAVPPGFWDALDDDDPAAPLREIAEDEAEVVVARRVPAEGRARGYLDGQAVSRDALAALVGALIRFSGQHDQRRLVGPAAQIAALDAFCGPQAQAAAAGLTAHRRRLAHADRELRRAADAADDARRRREELQDLVAAVDAAAPDPDDERALLAERERLRHAGRLAEGAAAAVDAVSADAGATAALGAAVRALAPLVDVDPALEPAARDLGVAQAAAQDAAIALRGYLDGLEMQPGRLEALEERLAEYARLRRMYGGTTEDVIRRAGEARAALADLEEGAGRLTRLREERDALLAEARSAAQALHDARAEAAPRLARAVEAELADLAMPNATLRVEVARDDGDPPRDRVTVWLRANPGLPEAPLADAASGGELSRVLLALHGVAAAADPGVAWVFDEVDAGIGGVTAAAVGRRLGTLAAGRQVVVITHLPQVAAAGDRHYRLVKDTDAATATTRIEPVEGDALVDEMCRMLGAAPGDDGARRHALELLGRRAAPPARRGRAARAA